VSAAVRSWRWSGYRSNRASDSTDVSKQHQDPTADDGSFIDFTDAARVKKFKVKKGTTYYVVVDSEVGENGLFYLTVSVP